MAPPSSIAAACLQLAFRAGDTAGNVDRAARGVEQAVRGGATLALLPELWDSGYHLPTARACATGIDAGAFAAMSHLARRFGLYLAGSSAERDGDRTYNTLALYGPDGARLGAYRKLHLFGPLGEDRVFTPGDAAQVVACPWGPTALSVCYDLRFPELYRACAVRGAVLALVSSAWPAARIDHWDVLLRARAIENGLAVVACNHPASAGRCPGFGGHSAVIDAQGRLIAGGASDAGVFTGALDPADSSAARSAIPVLRDRRPQVYGALDRADPGEGACPPRGE